MNKNYLNELKEIQNMLGGMKNINEAIKFADKADESIDVNPEVPTETPEMDAEMTPETGEGSAPLDNMEPQDENDALGDLGEVGQIRELCLKGMIKRCQNPNDAHYEALKKILQLCDKAVEEDNDEMGMRK